MIALWVWHNSLWRETMIGVIFQIYWLGWTEDDVDLFQGYFFRHWFCKEHHFIYNSATSARIENKTMLFILLNTNILLTFFLHWEMLQSGFIDWVEALVPQGLNHIKYQIKSRKSYWTQLATSRDRLLHSSRWLFYIILQLPQLHYYSEQRVI